MVSYNSNSKETNRDNSCLLTTIPPDIYISISLMFVSYLLVFGLILGTYFGLY